MHHLKSINASIKQNSFSKFNNSTARLTSLWAVSNCHSFSSPSVRAMITLAVPAEQKAFMFSETRHLMQADNTKYEMKLTLFLLIYLCISLQTQRHVSFWKERTVTDITTSTGLHYVNINTKPPHKSHFFSVWSVEAQYASVSSTRYNM